MLLAGPTLAGAGETAGTTGDGAGMGLTGALIETGVEVAGIAGTTGALGVITGAAGICIPAVGAAFGKVETADTGGVGTGILAGLVAATCGETAGPGTLAALSPAVDKLDKFDRAACSGDKPAVPGAAGLF